MSTMCDADDKEVRSEKKEKLKHADRLPKERGAPQLDSEGWQDLHRQRGKRDSSRCGGRGWGRNACVCG